MSNRTECNGMCMTGHDVGVAYGLDRGATYAHPGCPVHGDSPASIRDRVADALGAAVKRRVGAVAADIHTDALTDAALGVVDPEIASRDKRIRDIEAQLAAARAAVIREVAARIRRTPSTRYAKEHWARFVESIDEPRPEPLQGPGYTPAELLGADDGSTDE